ncbi:MAG: polyprenyl synthetase family protein [Gudongella sp.]|jgi:geranylgeranyl diphosphate synthase type II|nr:polyprenyl synthetase family protein [Gudongella sp.]
MRVTDGMGEYLDILNDNLRDAMKPRTDREKELCEAMEYSLFTGGKRLRPLMTIKAFEMYDEYIHDSIPFAMAIEMIHTYSLIHDDLPAMDNDDYRRGKPTSHKVYGEAIAILAGDGLLNLAFETMVKASRGDRAQRAVRAMYEVGKASGVRGMIGGQAIDLRAEADEIDEETLLYMYRGKTAALIQASILAGAILGGASDEDIENLREFGCKLGLAFQIQDDILDCEKDKDIGKCTYLAFNSLEKAEEQVKKLSDEAIEALEKLTERDTKFFKKLTLDLVGRSV